MSTWDPGTDTVCLLCNQVDECRDHLFLRCSFSEQVWNMVIKRLGYSPLLFHTWTALIAWLDICRRWITPLHKVHRITGPNPASRIDVWSAQRLNPSAWPQSTFSRSSKSTRSARLGRSLVQARILGPSHQGPKRYEIRASGAGVL